MKLLIQNASVYRTATRSFTPGDVLTENGRIVRVTGGTPLEAPDDGTVVVHNAAGRRLIPGLVDVHTHGRAGGDFLTADAPLMTRMSESYLRHGVTTVMPTLASATPDGMYAAIDRINALATSEETGPFAHIAGIHIEGCYLNPAKRGAHARELLRPLNADELDGLLGRIHGARHITAALELDPDGSFLRRALDLHATVGLGHTEADFATASELLHHGVTAMTHLFNAMPPLHHREGGSVAAGLLSDTAFCELICDGFHLAPHMVCLAARLLQDRLVLITDSMEATGCEDGEYRIAGLPVTVKNGQARTHEGAIAGSTLSLFEGVLRFSRFAGVPFGTAVYAATMAPAREIGISGEVGSIEPGKRADLLLLDETGEALSLVIVGGRAYTPEP